MHSKNIILKILLNIIKKLWNWDISKRKMNSKKP